MQQFSRRMELQGLGAIAATAPMVANTQPIFDGKTVQLVIGFQAGTPADVIGRLIARAGMPLAEVPTDEAALKQIVFATVGQMFHPAGTRRIGAGDNRLAVVAPSCRVIDVEELRVVDGSVMPALVWATPTSPSS